MAGGQEHDDEPQTETTPDLISEVNLGGRPRHYDTPEEFDLKVNEYYRFCFSTGFMEPLTWTGLSLFLCFSLRHSIVEYLNYDGFSDSVQIDKSLIDYGYEKKLHSKTPTGAIFALKNFKWSDKTVEEMEGDNPEPVLIQIVRTDASRSE